MERTTLTAPERVWWKPVGRLERNWLTVALAWCIFLTAMMPIWFFLGRQNVPDTAYKMEPQAYVDQVMAFSKRYQVGEEKGIPVVEPPPGSDVYLLARQWQFYPILKLKKGETYRLHLSSSDIMHGFSLQPLNLNFQVLPGYVHVIEIRPTQTGDYSSICNEFCGVGHHLMIGKLIVTD